MESLLDVAREPDMCNVRDQKRCLKADMQEQGMEGRQKTMGDTTGDAGLAACMYTEKCPGSDNVSSLASPFPLMAARCLSSLSPVKCASTHEAFVILGSCERHCSEYGSWIYTNSPLHTAPTGT